MALDGDGEGAGTWSSLAHVIVPLACWSCTA